MLEMQKIEPDARLGQFMRLFEDVEAEFIGLAIDALIMRLDERDGDADREPDGDDLGDQSGEFGKLARFYPDTRPADVKDAEFALATEDDEDDDPAEQHDEPEDDDPREVTALEGKQWWDCATFRSDDDEQDDEDCCVAGDDEVRSGTGPLNRGHFLHMDHITIGSEDDDERNTAPSYRMDQTRALYLHAENDA